jgi:carboxyl-terminal processing protease
MGERIRRGGAVVKSRFNGAARIVAAILLVVGSGIGLSYVLAGQDDLFLKTRLWIEVFGKVYTDVVVNYVDAVNPEKIMHAGIDGMLKTLDPYTVFLGEKESDEMELVTTGKYAGVGITIGMRDGFITVINTMEGFSAAKQGIQSGDRIIDIDGQNARTMTPDEVRNHSRGTPGTTVRMTVEREGEPKPIEFVLIREEIPVRNVTYSGFAGDGIGYIRLERFSRTAGEDVRNAIRELREKSSLKGIVLDLRDNPGGLLDMAVDVVSKFVPESTLVVSTRGRRNDSERKYFSYEKPMLEDTPMAVLIDHGSASASEIVAGAFQDLDRAVLVGTRSFGKGLVQTITRISDGNSLKITTGRYYTPSGRSIQEVDYFHRTKEGVVTVKPDSLRKEFRTAHDRKVLDGRGISPDSTVPEEPESRLVEELSRKAMFFKFANHLASQKKSIPDKFVVDDQLLKEFEAFLKEREFQYEEEAETKLKELREAASKERYGKSFYDDIDRLEKAVIAEKARAFQRYDKEIREALRLEIIGRLKGDKAAIAASIGDDRQLQVAVGLVKNKALYKKLLASNSR